MYYGLPFIVILCIWGIIAQSREQGPLIDLESQFGECDIACTSLAKIFGEDVFQQALSVDFTSAFFAQQQSETTPKCVILPTTSQQVSQAIQILREHNCHFAIKSGGHGMFAGASNAIQGVTMDLRHLNSLSIADDHSSTIIGTGKRWGDVYEILEPMNLTVVGGRATQLGVGGFILGGGISFTSRHYGWGCDNVRSFEVVLADGSITNVSYESHPDLYFALRGGGNQFGIVTQFELDTYPQGPIWGGHSFYLLNDLTARKQALNIRNTFKWTPGSLLQNFSAYAVRLACRLGYCSSIDTLLKEFTSYSDSTDPLAHIILSFAFIPYNVNTWVACLNRLYSAPVPHPPVFSGFATQDRMSVYSTNRVTNLSAINAEVDGMNVPGFRQSWLAATFEISISFTSTLLNIFIAEIEAINHIPGLIPSLIMQIITSEEIAAFQRKGGNAFGIPPSSRPLLLINSAIQWNAPSDDAAVQDTNRRIMQRAIASAREMGVWHRFVYQNYAGREQDVFEGYGDANRERLRGVQRRYDPEGVFSRLQPGYFRL